MKNLKYNCHHYDYLPFTADDLLKPCEYCKINKEIKEKKRLENKSQSNRNRLSKKQKKKFTKSANGALKSLNYTASAS